MISKWVERLKYAHFAEREKRNREEDAPMVLSITLSYFFHDNFNDLPEIKFMNLDGREYVYTADDTGIYKIEKDPGLKGSYNYSPPIYDKRKNGCLKHQDTLSELLCTAYLI